MKRNVIIFGASGNTGIEICKELSNKNIQNTAFVRSGSESKIEIKNTAVTVGNVLDPKDVEKTLSSNSFTDIIIALGSRDLKATGVRSKGTQNIVKAAEAHLPQSTLHLISALGVRDSWQQLKWIEKVICKLVLAKTMKEHELQEISIINSTINSHIIRPVALKNGPSTGIIHNQTQGYLPYAEISRADVAKYLVDNLLAKKQGISSICKAAQ